VKAAVLTSYGAPLELVEVDVDEPSADEVLIQTHASGICHTDRTVQQGVHGSPIPNVLGHEAAGVVLRVGSAVDSVRVGDHVVTCPSGFCGSCEWCQRGLIHLCTDKGRDRGPGRRSRVTWDGHDVTSMSGIGGYAEQLLVSERAVVPISKDMPLDRAALLGCAVVTGMGSVLNRARVRPGETVAVLGIGGVGLNVVQAARLSGAARIIAIDRIPAKLERALLFGATDVVDASATDAVAAVRELTGGGVDHSFEVVGRPETVEQALAMLRVRGTTTLVGVPAPSSRISVPPMDLMAEKRLQGSNMGSSRYRLDIPFFVGLYLAGRLRLDELVSQRIALADVNDALDGIDDTTGARSVITFA
jgi:S-(hydroxymethyl)glutathione dehydrogenase/alcohol dehydrogenase